MMVFISCCKTKLNDGNIHPASELYISSLFKKSLQYARSITTDDNIRILSAKYGLVTLDEQIRYYDKTLFKMSEREREEWSKMVISQANKQGIFGEETIMFLTGSVYSKYLKDYFKNNIDPMRGMSIGQRGRFLNESNSPQ